MTAFTKHTPDITAERLASFGRRLGDVLVAESYKILSDISWTDLVSDYFPAQSGFENAFLIEDLLT